MHKFSFFLISFIELKKKDYYCIVFSFACGKTVLGKLHEQVTFDSLVPDIILVLSVKYKNCFGPLLSHSLLLPIAQS